MSLTVTGVLLLSAVIHASWNALLKLSGDRAVTLAVLFGTMGIMAACALPFVPPMQAAGWYWLISAVLLHGIYNFGLILMYRHGDLSLAYPVARGLAPVVVLLLAMVLAGEVPGIPQIVGVGLICLGLGGFMSKQVLAAPKGMLYALMTGVIIASYTVIDGMGVRASGHALSFTAWLFTFHGLNTVLMAVAMRRRAFKGLVLPVIRRGVPAGICALVAYTGVLWGLGEATMGGVSAIRESSVVFAALIGTVFLGEPMGRRRIGAALIVCIGIGVLSLIP